MLLKPYCRNEYDTDGIFRNLTAGTSMTRTGCFRNLIAGTSMNGMLRKPYIAGTSITQMGCFINLFAGTSMTRTECFIVFLIWKPNCRDEYDTDGSLRNLIAGTNMTQTGCFRNLIFRDEYDTDGVRLFRVRGAGDGQVDFRAEQVSAFSYPRKCIFTQILEIFRR
jgi:hypothetical protein